MKDQADDVLRWYDNMNNPVPAWYKKHAKPIALNRHSVPFGNEKQ